MPLYHFNVFQGGQVTSDVQGNDLLNASAARREAIRFAGSLLRDMAIGDGPPQDLRIEVTDNAAKVLFEVKCSITYRSAD